MESSLSKLPPPSPSSEAVSSETSDEQLINILRNHVLGRSKNLPDGITYLSDVYSKDPIGLTELSTPVVGKDGKKEWYFITKGRMRRRNDSGEWHNQGKSGISASGSKEQMIGYRTHFSFKSKDGTVTGWILKQFRLPEDERKVLCKLYAKFKSMPNPAICNQAAPAQAQAHVEAEAPSEEYEAVAARVEHLKEALAKKEEDLKAALAAAKAVEARVAEAVERRVAEAMERRVAEAVNALAAREEALAAREAEVARELAQMQKMLAECVHSLTDESSKVAEKERERRKKEGHEPRLRPDSDKEKKRKREKEGDGPQLSLGPLGSLGSATGSYYGAPAGEAAMADALETCPVLRAVGAAVTGTDPSVVNGQEMPVDVEATAVGAADLYLSLTTSLYSSEGQYFGLDLNQTSTSENVDWAAFLRSDSDDHLKFRTQNEESRNSC